MPAYQVSQTSHFSLTHSHLYCSIIKFKFYCRYWTVSGSITRWCLTFPGRLSWDGTQGDSNLLLTSTLPLLHSQNSCSPKVLSRIYFYCSLCCVKVLYFIFCIPRGRTVLMCLIQPRYFITCYVSKVLRKPIQLTQWNIEHVRLLAELKTYSW